MPNFVLIGCYLQVCPWTYTLPIILNLKIIEIQKFYVGIFIDLQFNHCYFASMESIIIQYNLMADLSKFSFLWKKNEVLLFHKELHYSICFNGKPYVKIIFCIFCYLVVLEKYDLKEIYLLTYPYLAWHEIQLFFTKIF